MGRPNWGTAEQVAYLESFVPNLDIAKATCSLETEYERVYGLFVLKWPTKPTVEEQEKESDLNKLQATAEKRRRSQIKEWFKSRRKGGGQSQPTELLDLTGKTSRKPTPYQIHHAYSIRYHREPDSPLRKEVEDLFGRRENQDIIDLLGPFSTAKDLATGSRLNFHNAVMRWKCSLLTEEERQEMDDWIARSTAEKKEINSKPWKAVKDDEKDELSVENEFIRRSIDALPATIDNALTQIKRTTGMQAFIIIGGPAPGDDTDISTHMYEIGKSRDTDLTFSQSWGEGYETLHDAFVNWLRTVYTKDDISRRKGSTTTCKHTTSTQIGALDPTPVNSEDDPHPPPGVVSPRSPQIESPPLEQTRDMSPDRPASQVNPTDQTSQPSPPTAQDRSHSPSLPPAFPTNTSTTPQSENRDGQRSPHVTPPPSSRLRLDEPIPAASPAINGVDRLTDEQGSLATNHGDAGRERPPDGRFLYNGASQFVTAAALDYLQTIPAGQRWVDMITSYLRLEESPVVKGTPMRLLSAKSRPNEVSTWMKTRSYDPTQIPFISDVGLYSKEWTSWWTLCQPAWRQSEGWPLPREEQGAAKWGIKAGARGHNGIFLVIMSTTWWASSIKSAEDWAKFDEAMEDIQWVVDRMAAASQEALPVPPPPVPPTPSQEPMPAQGAPWMAREGGKRQPKPSRRMLEGGWK